MAEENKKALQEFLKILSDNPEIAERITITFKPAKLIQGEKPKSK